MLEKIDYTAPPTKVRIIVETPCDISGWRLIIRHMDGYYHKREYMGHDDHYKIRTYSMDGEDVKYRAEIDLHASARGISTKYNNPKIGIAFFVTIEFESISEEKLDRIENRYKEVCAKYPATPCKFVVLDAGEDIKKTEAINAFCKKLNITPNFVKVKLENEVPNESTLSPSVENLFEDTVREALQLQKNQQATNLQKQLDDYTSFGNKASAWAKYIFSFSLFSLGVQKQELAETMKAELANGKTPDAQKYLHFNKNLVRNEYHSSCFFSSNYGNVDKKTDSLSLNEGEFGEILKNISP